MPGALICSVFLPGGEVVEHIEVGGETFRLEVYRDDAGNFVADAIGPLPKTHGAVGGTAPVVRAVARSWDDAIRSAALSLERTYSTSTAASP